MTQNAAEFNPSTPKSSDELVIPRSPVTGRLEGIDIVRGLACFWVLLHHGAISWVYRIHTPVLWHIMDLARVGYLGVHLFLVISGFVLFFPVVRKHGIRQARAPIGTFFYRRCRRILPPYYAALLICILLSYWHVGGYLSHDKGPFDYVLHLTMLFNLDVRTIPDFNPAFWSLALEFQLYLTFPLLLWLCRVGGIWAVLGVTLVTSILWQDVVVLHLMKPFSLDDGLIAWQHLSHRWYALPGRWFEFGLGMAAAAAVMHPKRWKVVVAAVIVAVLTPIASHLVLAEDGQFGPARDQLWGLIFASVLVMTAAIPGRIVDSLPARLLAWCGGISYSVYLIHEPFLRTTRPILDHFNIPNNHRFGYFLTIGVPLMVIVGYVFHLLFERPFMSTSQRKLADPTTPAIKTA